jgi:hypothetical protein
METLKPREWVAISFRAPRRSPRVQVEIDGDAKFDVWVMPEEELGNFSEDDDDDGFEYYARLRGVSKGTIKFKPDGGEDWVLVLDNPFRHVVHVHYEVTW